MSLRGCKARRRPGGRAARGRAFAALSGLLLAAFTCFLSIPARAADPEPWRWGCLCRMTSQTDWPTEDFVVLIHVTVESRSELIEYLARYRLQAGRRVYVVVPACALDACRSRLFSRLVPVTYQGWIRVRIVANAPYTAPGGELERHRVTPGFRFEFGGK